MGRAPLGGTRPHRGEPNGKGPKKCPAEGKREFMKNSNEAEILLQGRLDGSQKNKLVNLLDMMYMPSELAEEVGFNKRQIYRVYVPAGCPHEKDEKGRLWINGKDFRDWATEVYKKQNLGENEAFCLTCKRPVRMVKPERKQQGRLVYYLCECPECGRKLSRIIERGKLKNDYQG